MKATFEKMSVEEKTIATIRTLAMDAVQKADSGHPGTPMALAPLAYVLWMRFLRYNPANPRWFNRDRFVLSNGHASMLQYALLYLTGYGLKLEDLKRFRQWGSMTPGHPEYGLTPGVECTTGPLGQGIMHSVGMAMAEAHLASLFNREGHQIIDHSTYAFCSDGDLMEGASHEAASLAGHLRLGKLIWVYDNNHISIEGPTEITYSDDVARRFDGYHWHVQDIGEKANDREAIAGAFEAARAELERPSLIIIRSHIAYGAPEKHDTPEAHGSPLGEEEVRRTKQFYGWPDDEQFLVPKDVLTHMRSALDRGRAQEEEWNRAVERYRKEFPELAASLKTALQGDLPAGWDSRFPVFQVSDGPMATRKASGAVVNAAADALPWLVGGSGDLSPSTKTLLKESAYIERGAYGNRNIAWGVREHLMCAASSGLALHGGIRPFASSFFIFTDYARPAMRLAALMGIPVIYVMTHDSIGLGEDGPTHQPVEHLASFRAMPRMCVLRPGDANETVQAWKAALERKSGPTLLVLTRQKLPVLDRSVLAGAEGVRRGAYVLSPEKGEPLGMILIASGSELQLALGAQEALEGEDVHTRVVSMPSWELFREQGRSYQEAVLPPQVQARVSIEAGSAQGWREWIGQQGEAISVEEFGASAPYEDVFAHYGFTVDSVVDRARKVLAGAAHLEHHQAL